MGRNEERQRAKFKFNNHRIEMYRPTDGQGAVLAICGNGLKKLDTSSLERIFKILEVLVVDPANWQAMDDALVSGDVELMVFMELLQDVFGYDWDGDAAKKRELAEQMRARALDVDGD